MPSEEKYDVVVAGLGPAGSVALWHLARSGLRVLGVETRSYENLWGKPCGDAIGAHHFSNAGLETPSGSIVKNVVKGIDIYSPGEEVRYRVLGEGYIINRTKLGQRLVKEAADKGAEVRLKTPVIGPIIENGRVKGVIISDGGRRVRVYASVVIEATGFSRVLKRKLPKEWPVAEDIDEEDTNIAYREIIRYNGYEVEEPEIIRIYIDQEIAPGGYWWFFPESKDTVNVGLGVQGGKGYESPMKIYREKLLQHPLLKKDHTVLTSAGAPVPTRRPANSLVGPGILVIGDAGYTVNPVHGGGMGYGFFAAYSAYHAILNAYESGDFSEEKLWLLNTMYMRRIGAKQAALDVFRRFLQSLSNDDILFGMKNRLIPEVDLYEVSSEGEIKISRLDKLMIVLRGLKRPTLLVHLKTVAEYMKKVKELYLNYPDSSRELPRWIEEVNKLFNRFEKEIGV